MYCPACGAANVDGAKFCGTCGNRIEVAAPASAPTADTAATIVRAPVVSDASLVAARPRGRGRLWALLAVDAALVAGGVVLWTRPASAPASAGAGGSAQVADGTPNASDAGAGKSGGGSTGGGGGGATGGGGGNTGSTTGGGSTGGGAAGGASTGGGSTGGSGSGSTGGGSTGGGSGSGSTGSGSTGGGLDSRLTDAAPASSPVDAAVSAPPVDATAAPGPDASAVTPPAVDAAEPTPAEIDAAVDVEVSAAVIGQEFARQIVASDGKLSRCYQTATKALPDDQPIVGEVDISLSVMPTGRIDNVRVDRNTTGSQTLASCVLAVVSAWSFSAHDSDAALAFVRTFRFGPGS